MSEVSDYKNPRFVRKLLRSLVPVTCPQRLATDEVAEQVVDDAETFMRTLPAPFRLGLAAGLTAYDLLATVVPKHGGRRASQLTDNDARSYYDWWASGPIGVTRLFAFGVKGMLAGALYEQPSVRKAIGYTPDEWVDKVGKRRLQVYREEIDRHEASLFEPDPLPLRDGTFAPARRALEEAS